MSIYVGSVLTANPAAVDGQPTPVRSWQWFRDGVPIAGATGETYTVVEADLDAAITVRQTETNMLGLDDATSLPTDAVLPFSPITLFASGEEGAWYDPSDLTTLYQDSAGTTPVTAAGQPVGLMLDKSKGGLQAEKITNGGFDDATGWTAGNGTLTISGGVGTLAGVNGPDPFFVSSTFSVNGGSWYKISANIISAGGSTTNLNYIRIRTAGSFAGAVGITVPSSFTGPVSAIVQIPAAWTVADVAVQRGGNPIPPTTTLVVDDISVRELPGNHATQSTSTARPTLAVTGTTPATLGSELVTNGTFDSDVSGWSFQANATGSAVGGEMEVTLSATSSRAAYQDITTLTGKWYLITLTARSASGEITAGAYTSGFGSLATETKAVSGSDVSFSILYNATVSTTRITVAQSATGSSETYYVDNVSVKEVLTWADPKYYLEFVADDLMQTAAFASPLAQPNFISLAGLLPDSTSVSALYFDGLAVGSRHYAYANKNSTGFLVGTDGGSYSGTEPDGTSTNVWSFNFDGAGSYLRQDGTQVATGNTGATTFGGLTLMGNINSAASPHTTNMHGFVLVNRTLDPAEIASLESYLADKSGVTLP